MTPITTYALHTDKPGKRSFNDDLNLHLRYGYVYSGQDGFVLARPVAMDQESHWLDIEFQFVHHDAWFIWAAGHRDPKLVYIMALRQMPFPLPHTIWQRPGRNGYRVYETEHLVKKTSWAHQ